MIARTSRQTVDVMMRRGLVLCVAVIASACTEEAAITPPTATLTTTTTTEAPPTPSTTAAPDTTLAPETTVPETTTTVPPTTTAPTTTALLGDPTTVSTEYFIGGDLGGWLYLGRWTGSDWEGDRDDDQELREPSASNGDAVIVHELDAAPVEGSIDGSAEACADGRTGPVITPNPGAATDTGFRSIAFPADWSTEPRTVALVDASIESYVAAGVAAFADLDIDATGGTIQQLVVTDLDGDGDTEALVSFGADAFSTLLIIDADSGDAIRVARSVTETVTPTTVAEDDEPGEPTTTPADIFRTLAVADLNGDGRAEIVAHAFDGSDSTVTAYTYDGAEVDAALTAGC